MASTPGFLTDWPWTPLGNFKYIVLAPGAIHSTYLMLTKGKEADLGYFFIFPFLVWRMVHNQIWISYSRYRTAKGNNLIVDKSIDFDQVDRERNWDDQIILNGVLFQLGLLALKSAANLPLWRTDGAILIALIHAGPVEFLYYWLHRALHHHYLYSRYHSHHHSSIVTEPITSVIHPFGEHIAYFLLFAIPLLWTIFNGTCSLFAMAAYITYIDFMNNMGHCNFEHIPKWLFSVFPPLKYLMYTPSYHSLHHTQFRTNYSLFMPFYDYVYGTMDKSSESLYERSLEKGEECPDVVYLTHLTTPQSVYQTRLGFASVASQPLSSRWYLWLMWPVTLWSMILTWIYGRTFIVDRITFDKNLKMQSWAIPRYVIHYSLKWQRENINNLIEEAILEADKKNIKVISLGLLNQREELNRNGEMYILKYPKLKVKLVDGSSLAAAVVLNTIPPETSQIVLRGKLSKVAYSIAFALFRKGVQITTLREDDYEKLKMALTTSNTTTPTSIIRRTNLNMVQLLDKPKPKATIWLVGEGLSDQDQSMAPEGTLFIPFSQFPPKKLRNKRCIYHNTPALLTPPSSLSNLHACENWLPRNAMSAWRVAGILHALEGWNVNECGLTAIFDVDKVWKAALHHGFRPLISS